MEVAERITAPQRSSTRTIYKSKWVLFEKWCRENSVDFSTSSVKQVSDSFMYLYQDLIRCPLTIDSYRMTIVDILDPAGAIFLKALTLTGFFLVFTGIIPKDSGIFQSGTFLLYLCWQDPVAPEVLNWSNQRPEKVSVPTLYFLQERTYFRHQARYSLFLVKQTLKLMFMILGLLRPFTMGFWWTK